jgi:putative tricarboxylic transport membrane protein
MSPEPAATAARTQTAVGALIVLTGLALGFGASFVPGEAGYGGVGPNFLPWVVAAALVVCGVLVLREARTGGFRQLEVPSGAARAWWPGLAWVSAGLLANAALITTIGFILGCTLCYACAAQGLRRSQGQRAGSARVAATDVLTGLAIAAPVYWTFTKLLAISLPGLTKTGWI